VKDPEVVTALTEALEDADARVRETTARALGKMGSEAAVAPLGRALQDAEADVRQAAARALAAIPTKDATDWLRKGLQDADGEVVLDCAEALEKRGEAVPVELLIRALQEGEGRVRGRVAQALARRDEAPALAALRALYYEQPPTSEPHAFRLARLLRPLATCEDEEGNRWAAFQWHKLGNGGDLWLTRARGGGKWELPIFTGVSLKPWLPQVTLKVTADGRVVVHSGGGYGPPEGQFRPEQEWTWQLRDLQQDRDSDGLPDLEEARMFTNPKRADTDGDGVPDGRDGNPLAARSQIPTDLEQIRQAVFLHAFMLNSEGHWGEVVPLQIADGAPQEFNGYPGPVLCLTPEQAARWNEQSSEGHGAPTLGPVRIDAKRGEARVRFTYAPGRGGGLPGPHGCEFLLRKKRGVWVVMEQETVWE
jgi:hypothetical protein